MTDTPPLLTLHADGRDWPVAQLTDSQMRALLPDLALLAKAPLDRPSGAAEFDAFARVACALLPDIAPETMLDKLTASHVLPILNEVTRQARAARCAHIWKHQPAFHA